jgi:NMD protein affecting ribosome stability and mRNA decay
MKEKLIIEKLDDKKKEILEIKGLKSLKFCYFCFSYNIANVWKEKSLNELIEEIKDYLKIKNLKTGEEKKVKNIILLNEPEFKNNEKGYLNFEVENTYLIKIPYLVEICPHCKKVQGTYHEAVIQFRGVSKEIIKEFSEELIKKEVFTKDAIEKKEGIDVKVTDKRVARNLAKKFAKKYGLEFKLTTKLITYNHEKGKEVYRDFILLRQLPKTKFVYYKGNFWLKKEDSLINLESREKIKLPKASEMEEVEVEELEKINEDKEGAYFMDKEFNVHYFKAKKVLKLRRGNEERYYVV